MKIPLFILKSDNELQILKLYMQTKLLFQDLSFCYNFDVSDKEKEKEDLFVLMMSAVIQAIPEFAVIDDEIDIIVTGLRPNSAVTVDASIVYFKVIYIGFGYFFSDDHGTVHLTKDASHGGTYAGLQSMGLFNSMRPMPSKSAYPRLLVAGSVEKPLIYKLSVWKGHLIQDEIHQLHFKSALLGTGFPMNDYYQERFLCQCDIKRTYMSPNVVRILIKIEVENEPIRGILFVPKGQGPFPGVIDMFGGAGGCVETRAALLAKHGFISLALAYFGFDDLKANSLFDYKIEYFDKAIKWFSHHPSVKPGGISMVGVCAGAQTVLLSSMRNENVRSAVCINANLILSSNPNTENSYREFYTPFTSGGQIIKNTNHCEILHGTFTPNLQNRPQIERPILNYKHDNPILFLLGEHDNLWKSGVNDVIEQLKRSGKKNVQKIIVKGQGHLIEPPYMPLCAASTSPGFFVLDTEHDEIADTLAWNWNGNFKNHGPSQLEAWNILLDFLHKHSNHEKSKL